MEAAVQLEYMYVQAYHTASTWKPLANTNLFLATREKSVAVP